MNGSSGGLSEDELELFSRQIVLDGIGYEGQLRLGDSRICIAGMGGLGLPAASQLVAMGVGHLRIVDRDVVETSNLHRQRLYTRDSIGLAKAEVAADKLKSLGSDTDIEPLPLSIGPSNAKSIVAGMDVVLDGLDNMTSRYALNRACVADRIPYVFGAATGLHGVVATIVPGRTPCLECFYGHLDKADLPTCGTAGVHPSILGIVSSIEVSEVVSLVVSGEATLEGSMLHCDLKRMAFDRIGVKETEKCPVCGESPTSDPGPLKEELAEELCGRGGRRVFIITPGLDQEPDLSLIGDNLGVGGKLIARGRLGLTFDDVSGRRVSVLSSGVAVIEGPRDRAEAVDIWQRVLALGGVFPSGRPQIASVLP